MSVSLLERQDKTSAKPEKIALPVTPLWRSHLLCEGECKERDWWLSQVNPQTPQGSFACFSLGCKGEFIRKVSVWRVLPTLLVSTDYLLFTPFEVVGCHSLPIQTLMTLSPLVIFTSPLYPWSFSLFFWAWIIPSTTDFFPASYTYLPYLSLLASELLQPPSPATNLLSPFFLPTPVFSPPEGFCSLLSPHAKANELYTLQIKVWL